MYEAKGLVSWRSGQYSGPAVDRAGIRGRNILLSIFVFMFEAEVGVFDDLDWFQGPSRFGNRNRAADTLQVLRPTPFVPNVQLIASIRHIGDGHAPGPVGRRKVRGADSDYGCAHFRVNIAEQIAHSHPVKVHRLAGPRFVKSEVKSLAVEE